METAVKPYAFSRKVFCEGMRDGVPIALGYFAVSFSLGIAARNAGLTPIQGFVASLFNNASAGEYAAFSLIAAGATYVEVAIITLIANARYLLMSCALAQRFAPGTPFFHRLIIGYDVTDELFGINYCARCQVCTAGCPARAINPDYIGPSHMLAVAFRHFDPYDQADRIVEAVQGGLWDCTMCGTCTAHCNQLEIDHLAIWQKLRDAATERGLVKQD